MESHSDLSDFKNNCDKFSVFVVNNFIYFTSACTLSYHMVFIFQVKAFYWYVLTLLIYIILVGIFKEKKNTFKLDSLCIKMLALCFFCLCINIFTLRPDMDDVSYFFRGLFYAEHMDQPINKSYTLMGIPGVPEISPLHQLSALEASVAFIAKGLNIPGMFFIHQVVGGWALFFAPIVYYRLLRLFGFSDVASLIGAFAAIIYLILNGSTAASAGNYSIVRAWQGKCFLIFIALPLVWSSLLTYFESNNKKEVYKLYLLTVIGIGLSSSAFFLLPFSAGIFTCSYILAHRSFSKYFKNIFFIAASLLIIIAYLAVAHSGFFLKIINTDVWKSSYPSDLVWQFTFALPRFLPIALTLIFFYLVSPKVILRHKSNTLSYYALFVLLIPALPFINNVLLNVLTPTVFWRLFCAFPGALLFGACWSTIKDLWGSTKKFKIVLTCISSLMFAINTPTINDSVLSMPHLYKFPKEDLTAAEYLQAKIKGGATVAGPEKIIGVLAPLRPDLIYYSGRYNDTMHALRNAPDRTLITKRAPWVEYFKSANPADLLPEQMEQLDIIDIVILPQPSSRAFKNYIKEYSSFSFIDIGIYTVFFKHDKMFKTVE